MMTSAGKEEAPPARNSVDSSLKLFGRNISISISQDPCSVSSITKHGKSSKSREAGEYRRLDAKEEEKNLKKPETIVPCPRCDSCQTKFCYFNNYNVNQPRHFCKHCHRYWTAGGTMRNVPVGAGRRRNKLLASQFCQRNATLIEESDSANRPPSSNVISNINLLNFGLLPESMEPPVEESSTSGSSITTATNAMNEFSESEAIASSRPSEHCKLVVPPGWERNLIPAIRWHPPGAFDIGNAYGVNSRWCYENGDENDSGILGKHCREVKLDEEGRVERSVVVPKTLRADDPEEASKSPIWASLGFKPYSPETKF